MRWPPDHGWVITATLAVTETIAWGVLYYAFAVFQVPMARDLGWSPAVITGAFSVALLVSGLAAPFVGRWVDQHGGRWLMTGGSVLGALLLVAWSRVGVSADSAGADVGTGTIAAYYLIWAGIGLAMAATLYEPAFAVVTAWFTGARARLRSRSLLVITLAGGLASTIFLPLASRLAEQLGWRGALVALAVILAVGTGPAHALILRRPSPGAAPARPVGSEPPPVVAPGARLASASTAAVTPGGHDATAIAAAAPVARQAAALSPDRAGAVDRPPATPAAPAPNADDHAAKAPVAAARTPVNSQPAAAARRDPGFWLLGAALFLGMLVTVAGGLILIPYLISRGFSPALAATLTGLTGAFQVGARLAVTLAGDRRPAAWLLAVLFGLEALALALLAMTVAPVAVVVAVALVGTARGAVTLLRAAIVVERYGPAHFGAINGELGLIVGAAAAAAPLGAGLVLTAAGSYLPILLGLAVACLGAMVAAARLHRRPGGGARLGQVLSRERQPR